MWNTFCRLDGMGFSLYNFVFFKYSFEIFEQQEKDNSILQQAITDYENKVFFTWFHCCLNFVYFKRETCPGGGGQLFKSIGFDFFSKNRFLLKLWNSIN